MMAPSVAVDTDWPEFGIQSGGNFIQDQGEDEAGQMVPQANPARAFASFILFLLGWKVLTQLRIINLDLAEPKITPASVVTMTLVPAVGFGVLKVGNGLLLNRGIVLPFGIADYIATL